jgi:type I restriction enzyme S subunit
MLLTLQDTGFKRRAIDAAVGTGVKHLRVGDVGDLRIPVAPLAEQREIVRRVKELFVLADNLDRRYEDTVLRVERLTPSVLAKAFRGELVPQDPNDEPAERLLERVRVSPRPPRDGQVQAREVNRSIKSRNGRPKQKRAVGSKRATRAAE